MSKSTFSIVDETSSVDEFFEKILDWVKDLYGDDLLAQEKDHFFKNTGKVFPEDLVYNARMGYFIDYFIFQYRLVGDDAHKGFTPFEAYINQHIDPDPGAIFGFRHSLFKVKKVAGESMVLRDLLTPRKLEISRRPEENFAGIQKGDLIQGFVYLSNSHNFISRGVIFHPTKSWPPVKRFLKAFVHSRALKELSALLSLAENQLRHIRHAHVNPQVIYERGLVKEPQ